MEQSLAQGTKKVSLGDGSEKEKETSKKIDKIHVPEDDDP